MMMDVYLIMSIANIRDCVYEIDQGDSRFREDSVQSGLRIYMICQY